jgi:uncharacterized coiled-coil protein SlyX
MPKATLEQRVDALEQQLAALKTEVVNGRDQKPWLRVQGIFAGAEGMREIFEEALKLRERDRQRARRRPTNTAPPHRGTSCS